MSVIPSRPQNPAGPASASSFPVVDAEPLCFSVLLFLQAFPPRLHTTVCPSPPFLLLQPLPPLSSLASACWSGARGIPDPALHDSFFLARTGRAPGTEANGGGALGGGAPAAGSPSRLRLELGGFLRRPSPLPPLPPPRYNS